LGWGSLGISFKSNKNMKYVLCLFVLAFNLSCTNKEKETIKTNIVNTISSQHSNIPGTHIHVIIPGGFRLLQGVSGMTKSENINVVFFESRSRNYYQLTDTTDYS
jgi:hypothetical protein